MPRTAGTASSSALFLGDHDRAMGLASMAQLHRHAIRGVYFEEVVDAIAEGRAAQLPAAKYPARGRPGCGRCDSRCEDGHLPLRPRRAAC